MAQQTIGVEPAFPEVNHEKPKFSQPTYGLTKREYFAAMAMQGWLSKNQQTVFTDYSLIASHAVGYADALIEQLNQKS